MASWSIFSADHSLRLEVSGDDATLSVGNSYSGDTIHLDHSDAYLLLNIIKEWLDENPQTDYPRLVALMSPEETRK